MADNDLKTDQAVTDQDLNSADAVAQQDLSNDSVNQTQQDVEIEQGPSRLEGEDLIKTIFLLCSNIN